MSAIKGIYKNGQIVLETPAEWPEGTEVLVEPVVVTESTANGEGEDLPDPGETARLLALMDQIQPLLMTAEEEAEWQAARQRQRDFDKATFEERAEKLRRIWE